MSHDGGICDADAVQEAIGVLSESKQSELILGRLCRLAESNLIRHNDPVPIIDENLNCGIPGGTTEVLSVEQDNVAFRSARW